MALPGEQRKLDRDRFAKHAVEHSAKSLQRSIDVYQERGRLLPATEGQQLPRQGSTEIGGLLDFEELRAHAERRVGSDSEVGVAADRRQKIVEVVCNAAGEPSERFHLLRMANLFFE